MPDSKQHPMTMPPTSPAAQSVTPGPWMEYEYYSSDSRFIDLFDFIRIMRKRRWWIICGFSTVFLCGLFYVFFSTPIYRNSVILQITQDKAASQLTLDDKLDALTGNDIEKFQNTQYKILESWSLARGVFNELNLKNHPYFQKIKESNKDLDEHELEEIMIQKFMSLMYVTPIKNTFLVEVSFLFPDNAIGQKVANDIADEYVRLSVNRRNESMMFVQKWLNKQLQDMAVKVQDAQKKLYQFSQKNDIYTLEDKDNVIIQKYVELSSLLTKAQADTMAKEAQYRQIKEKGTNSPLVVNNPLVAALRQQLVTQQAKVSSLAKIYRGGHPELQAEQANLAELQNRLNAETQRIEESAKADYEAAKRTQQLLNDSIKEQKGQLANLEDNLAGLQILKRDAGTNEELYQALLARVKEANISATMIPANVTVIDHAILPSKPYRPMPVRDLAIAAGMGLFLGIGLAFLVEFLDSSIKSVEDMEQACNLPVLGVIPSFSVGAKARRKLKDFPIKGRRTWNNLPQLWRRQEKASDERDIIVATNPQSPATEAIRHAHTAIMLSMSGRPPKSIMVTSANPSEGKSLFSCNLASLFAIGKSRTVLIDCDLRKPRLHRVFNVALQPGLSNYLVGSVSFDEIVRMTSVPNLSFISAGTRPPNPSNLIGSQEFKDLLARLQDSYDHVIIDTPPILGFSDGLVISALTDGVLLVVKHNSTLKSAGRLAYQLLNQVHAPLMGAVLNYADFFGNGGYYYFDRRSYYNRYYGSDV